jgi:hypothetical protein
MGWLDFFKQKTDEKKDTRKINFGSLLQEAGEEKEKAGNKIKEMKEKLAGRIAELNASLEAHIGILKAIDLSKRKEHERLKMIVLENLGLYISNLQNFKENIKNLDNNDKDYLGKISFTFENFQKNSMKFVDKATILIGKEIADTKKSLKAFSEDVNSMINENQQDFEKEKNAAKMMELLADFEEENNLEKEIIEFIPSLHKKAEELNYAKKDREKDIEALRSSAEYLKAKEADNERLKQLQQAKIDLIKLKEEIDLKVLLRDFHKDEKKSALIKEYSDNFEQALRDDSEFRIIEIVKQSKPGFNEEKIREMRNRIIELNKKKQTEAENKMDEIISGIKRIDLDLIEANNNIEEQKEKQKRLIDKREEIRGEIIKQAISIWNDCEIIF